MAAHSLHSSKLDDSWKEAVVRLKNGLIVHAFLLLLCLDGRSAFAGPKQWTVASGGNGHWYDAVFVPGGVTWTEAKNAAEALGEGWHLATVTSAEENAFIFELFGSDPAFYNCCLSGNGNGPWIGGFATTFTSRDWQWVTGEPFTYSAWGPFEPLGNGNRISYFGYRSATVQPVWNDTPDSYPSLPPLGYIIETSAPVVGPPCEYSFSKGSGVARIAYCVTDNGTIARLEGPASQEHVANGQAWEGFVVCSGTSVQAWDLSATADGFGATTVLAGPKSTGVTLRRTSTQFQLDQVFKLDSKEKDVTITMTLTNISGAMIPDVRLARAYDPDPNNDAGDDLETTSARGVFAVDTDAVTLTGTTWGTPTDTAVDTGSAPACSPTGGVAPRVTGDASLAVVTYHLGSMKANAKKKVVFVYRVQ